MTWKEQWVLPNLHECSLKDAISTDDVWFCATKTVRVNGLRMSVARENFDSYFFWNTSVFDP